MSLQPSLTPTARPLNEVHNELIALHSLTGIKGEVTRRLKKSTTIFDKLTREPGLDLARMQDIGGCRSVVTSRSELVSISEAIVAHWGDRISRLSDYVDTPRKSGYRAIHIVVLQDERQIEIQLRSKIMHDWAQTVEAFSGFIGENYKQDGDHLIQKYLRAESDILSAYDTGETPDSAAVAIVDELREKVEALIDSAAPRPGRGATQ